METVEVPFIMVGGRRALTEQQLFEDIYLRELMLRFRQCFEYDPVLRIYYFLEGPR